MSSSIFRLNHRSAAAGANTRPASNNNSGGGPTPLRRNKSSLSTSNNNNRTSSTLFCCGITGAVCFYAGLVVGHLSASSSQSSDTTTNNNADFFVERRVREELSRMAAQHKQNIMQQDGTAPRFGAGTSSFAVGAGLVDRDDFFDTIQLGVPVDLSDKTNHQVLLLYQNVLAFPDNAFQAAEAASPTTPLPVMESTVDAVQNCDALHVVLTDHSSSRQRRQCIAVTGQYEAFHIQKYMRLPVEKGKLNSTLPLRYVNRGAQDSGRKSTPPPSLEQTRQYWSILQSYFSTFDDTVEQLRTVIENKVNVIHNNTVTVLVCNFGQSELLLNFVCHASQNNLDLSNILVFATDAETAELAEHFGLAVFYDAANYADMPKQAANRYADKTFMKIMMAKVFCVQMTAWLGYDVLFQDVDVIWYQNPVTAYFHNSEIIMTADNKNKKMLFDIYFQDDGNHALYYAPYSANTGFYYVRHNERTRHFLNSFLVSGDLILSTHSHQVPLVALLQEHASMYGLTVKIFERTGNDFPGGHAFHRRKDFMHQIMDRRDQQHGDNTADLPYIFHMSWTHNKDNKIKYYRQMGEWYLQDQCIQTTADDIIAAANDKKSSAAASSSLIPACCAAEALFSCHYRDKPSLKPCKDSPPIDKGKRSWW